jgi:hypothetical protein
MSTDPRRYPCRYRPVQRAAFAVVSYWSTNSPYKRTHA